MRFTGEGPDRTAGVTFVQAIPGNGIQQYPFFLLLHGLYRALGESEVNEGVDGDMIGTAGEGSFNVQLKILIGLLR